MSAPPALGSTLICDSLRSAGIDCVFGLPGSQTISLYEALRTSSLRTIVATHELSAAMMANGYYRSSGRMAALVTIPGPGFTWALTGLAEAFLDSAALLHIVGQPANSPGQRFQLQAIEQEAIARALVKSLHLINHAGDMPGTLASAHADALAGEPGPVLVQVARGALAESADILPAVPSQAASPFVDPAAIDQITDAVTRAKRCVLFLGQGCNDAADLVLRLAENLSAVVMTTTSGRGVVPEDHPLSLGFESDVGGTDTLNALIDSSDLVLAIGCKFSHNGSRGFCLRIDPDKLVHVDASAQVLGANYAARLTLCADARAFLAALLQQLDIRTGAPRGFSVNEIKQWRQRCREEMLKDLIEPRIPGVPSGTPAAFFDALRKAMPRRSCLVTDSGQHQSLVRRHFRVLHPRGLIVPTNLQSMGFGIGAAIGACLANPNRPVVALIGDGGLAMSGLELLTAVREGLQLTVIVFVDGAYGLIRFQQLAAHGCTHGTELKGPELTAFAAAIGARYLHLGTAPEATLRKAMALPGVTLVEVSLGDTLPMHWMRAKGSAKRLLGPRVRAWLQSLRG
ncbi:MAG: thiamine pyrophosphate-binding protein [Rhodanobacter sp.]